MPLPPDLLAPPSGAFTEPWHAQTLAMANAMISAGHITPQDWANALGAALAHAEKAGAPDTEATYFQAALSAVEDLTTQTTALTQQDLATRKAAWSQAYLHTPHGQPVTLDRALPT